MKRIVIIIISILAILAGVTVCNNKVTPDNDNKEVKELKAMILNEDGTIAFDKAAGNDRYQIGVENREDAAKLAGMFAENIIAEDNYTRTLQNGMGTVTVSLGKASIYYSVQFCVKDIPEFTLLIKNAKTIAGDITRGQGGTYHKCPVCGFNWRSTSNTCPMTTKHAGQ